MNIKRSCLAMLLAGTAFAAFNASAAENKPLAGCVDLGTSQEIVRSGGASSMLLRDGESHYLLTFRDDCGSLATASRVSIVTEGAENRMCPQDTVVKTKRDNCRVRAVEEIDAEQFASRKRRAAR